MKPDPIIYENLKKKHRAVRDQLHDNLNLRVHRALSWLHRAEQLYDNEKFDESFILYWISFNAIYSAERIYRPGISEKDVFSDFFCTIEKLDKSKEVYNVIWTTFSNSVRTLIKNKHVYQPFWESVYKQNLGWEKKFEESKKQFNFAFSRQDTIMILCILFDRLYVLRNQLVHGGATLNGGKNRPQIRDGADIMAFLTPLFINLMIDNPNAEWPRPFYPVTE